MNHQLSFSQYRSIDLTMFAVIMCISEAVLVTAATSWYPDQLYTVSLAGAITAIVLMRWGPYAAIHAVLGGLVFSLVSHGTLQQVIIYAVGNLLSMVMLIPRNKLGPERIRTDGVLSVCFGLVTLLLMQLGRALVALATGTDIAVCAGFFATDVLSLLFTGVIIWIARRLDGIFEDQKHYLLRIHNSEE